MLSMKMVHLPLLLLVQAPQLLWQL